MSLCRAGPSWRLSKRCWPRHRRTPLAFCSAKLHTLLSALEVVSRCVPPAASRATVLCVALSIYVSRLDTLAFVASFLAQSFSPTPTELHDVVDFDALFTGTLVAELTNTHEAYRIVRRRICELIGQWASVRFDKTGKLGLRTGLYQLMVNLLGPGEDLVVRITAMGTLKSVVNDFGFQADEFLPHLNGVMGALFQLLVDVEQCESKMKVLDMINELVDRMGPSIQVNLGAMQGWVVP